MKRTWVVVAGVAFALVLGGCKSKQTAAPVVTKTPSATPSVRPSITPSVVPVPSASPAATPSGPLGRDALDSKDERVAGVFPKTGEVGTWYKTCEVNVHPGTASDLLRMNVNPAGYLAYGVDWAADAAYQFSPADADKDKPLFVQLFHCAKPDGAFGLLTVNSSEPSRAKFGPGTEVRGNVVDSADQLFVCKGNYLLCVWSTGTQSDKFTDAMQQMAKAILDKLPPGDVVRPEILKTLPARGLTDSSIRVFRGDEFVRAFNPGLAGEALIESDEEMAVAEYQTATDRPVVQMFVIRYRSADRAREAGDRLTRAQGDARATDKEAVRNFKTTLLVGGVKGAYVFGSLTGDEYGLLERAAGGDAGELPVMPTIKDRLP